MMAPKKPEAPKAAPATVKAAQAAKVVTVQDFINYSAAIDQGDVPAGYKVAVGALVTRAVEAERLGEKPDLGVLRKNITMAAKDEGLPVIMVVSVP